MLSSIGLPGTNGFVGEFLVLLGAFRANVWWAAIAATGVILSACYMLWMFQRVIFGPVTHEENRGLADLSLRERLVFAPLLVLIFWIGVMPQPVPRPHAAVARPHARASRSSAPRRPRGCRRAAPAAPFPRLPGGGAR